jgi:hypothetical protein
VDVDGNLAVWLPHDSTATPLRAPTDFRVSAKSAAWDPIAAGVLALGTAVRNDSPTLRLWNVSMDCTLAQTETHARPVCMLWPSSSSSSFGGPLVARDLGGSSDVAVWGQQPTKRRVTTCASVEGLPLCLAVGSGDDSALALLSSNERLNVWLPSFERPAKKVRMHVYQRGPSHRLHMPTDIR